MELQFLQLKELVELVAGLQGEPLAASRQTLEELNQSQEQQSVEFIHIIRFEGIFGVEYPLIGHFLNFPSTLLLLKPTG